MSWSCWTVDGFGIDCSNLSDEGFLKFCKEHKESLGVYRDGIEQAIEEDWDSDEIRDMTNNMTLVEIIAHVMNLETGIVFEGIGISDESCEAVMFLPAYPWQMNEKERNLTAEELKAICGKYAEELENAPVGALSLTFSG